MTLALVPRPNERLTPLERLEVLCDPGSLDLLRTEVLSRRMGFRIDDIGFSGIPYRRTDL